MNGSTKKFVARANRKEESRNRILDVASRAVRRQGFHGVGVAEVMREAGLTHGGFYAHFDSRDALLSAAVVRAGAQTTEGLAKNMSRLISAGFTPFHALVESYLYVGEISNREGGCAVAALCADVPMQSLDVATASRELIQDLHRLVEQTLPTRRPKNATWAVVSALLGALQLARAIGDNEQGAAVLADVKREILAQYADE